MPLEMRQVRQALPHGPQIRSYPAEFEVRSLAGAKVELRGYASTTEQAYDMYDMFGPYTEIVSQGAFGKTLAEGADVAFLTNHEGLTLARTKAGSLSLAEDSTGLEVVTQLNTARADARDLMLAIEDGDVDEMSFAFRIVRQQWSPDYDERRINEVNLNRGDVSAVNFGANPTTSIGAARSFRKQRPAELHRMAVELREGKALSAATMEVLSQVLDLLATADDAVDRAQPLLADLMGVPNPDDEQTNSADAGETERALAHLNVLRLQEQHARERKSA